LARIVLDATELPVKGQPVMQKVERERWGPLLMDLILR
jgi:hypothetical protein